MPAVPIIGITTYGRDETDKYVLPVKYVESVRRAGGAAFLIPPGEPHYERLLAKLDGLIIAGGGDIDPKVYGGSDHPDIYMVDPDRDTMEIAMAKTVVENGMPTLSICRGSQIINIALGGTLFPHVPDEFGESVKHRLPPREPVPHPIEALKGSKVAEVMHATEVEPASWHHQAMREVAPKLEIVAYAPDGVIEALELPGHPWLLAVQWHPEETAAEDPTQQRLFDALVEAAKAT